MAGRVRAAALLAAALLAGCEDGPRHVIDPPPAWIEPEHVVVQHLLVGFAGSVPGKEIQRSQDEAEALATAIYHRALAGADFDEMIRTYSADTWPGIYGMANRGVPPDPTRQPREYPRGWMIPAFGDVGFHLEVGGFGLATYDPKSSPYGWHVIRRLQ